MVTALATAHAKLRCCLYVTPHAEQADQARDDLELFTNETCNLFPPWDSLPTEGSAGGEVSAERLRTLVELPTSPGRETTAAEPIHLLVAPIQALLQPVPTPATLERNTLYIEMGVGSPSCKKLTPDSLVEWAIEHGFERLPLVESPGDVARRGDVVDLFVPGESIPVRVQFLDDQVESIRTFDPSSQRSITTLSRLTIRTADATHQHEDGAVTDLTEYLPTGTLVVLDEPSEVQSMGEVLRSRIGDSEPMFEVCDVLQRLGRFPQLHLSAFGHAAVKEESTFDFGVRSLTRFERDAGEAVRTLCWAAKQSEVHVVCDTEGERQRLDELIGEALAELVLDPSGSQLRRPQRPQLHLGHLWRGFEWPATNTWVVGHQELFQVQRHHRRVRRVQAGRPLESWVDLASGEFVVHVLHGIAKYRGLKTMSKGDSKQKSEFLCLEFADQAKVYVPSSQIDLVQKYIGTGGRKPELSKLGGKRWDRMKQNVIDSVGEMAESLLRAQALREESPGTAYPADTQWQREFEAAFPFEETEDQLLVAAEIREDLMKPRSMDRLVCGDVGYGKTELAMRAAFKVVEYGRQVAVLVPTTILAEQHHTTFRERMVEYPFSLACLSRFRSSVEQRTILEGLKKGQIDIVIGTHRLISRDVRFANLGLVIIDEEQRFGVEHKERLRAMRETVDVLTLTATPIPRTLHMSLMGVRDISSLQTPPVDRRAIATQVCPFNRSLIRDAILRELNRDGQVFFVHNIVRSIAGVTDTIRAIVPEARVVMAHGQMNSHLLEEIMHRFLRREADVLVCTTIIESGMDIPSANTIFIDGADRFGLADLHQLRGRVGRSDHRAYCYLLLPPDRPPTGKAAKRLKTVEEFSELGAGFRIAMRDLEIRGAGNLLGREQSGHIAAVGYDMYCQLLKQVIRRLRNEPDPTPAPVQVDLDVTAHIPQHYISSQRGRLEMYRRLVSCVDSETVDQLEADMRDAFGPIPKEVERLLEVTQLRCLCRPFGVLSITRRPPDIIFVVKDLRPVEPVFVDAEGSVRIPDAKTIYFRPPASYLEPQSLLPILRSMFRKAQSAIGIPA